MRLSAIFLSTLLFCSCYSSQKKLDAYIGTNKDSLLIKKGQPLTTYADSTGERLLYAKPKKIHNPKYTEVVRYTTFFLNRGDTIYKWKTETVKTKPPTGKPSMAIDSKK